ncbi:hypothetical protein Rhopal_000437-T1 [Rhodotorula paludigena]|uniref:Uncharacterized protein n=1 Tax=Rhodotorula paludigena TaxID=86838 RepID=A0AAV5GFR0_9BASI|nr:hypothetical protein Rhopal_000437-T1 [Rhodotorula paludigena]
MLAHTTQNGYQLLQLELGQLALAGHACKGTKLRTAVQNFVVAVHAFIPNESSFSALNTVQNNFQQGYGNYARAAVVDLNRRLTAGHRLEAKDIARLDDERIQVGFEIVSVDLARRGDG